MPVSRHQPPAELIAPVEPLAEPAEISNPKVAIAVDRRSGEGFHLSIAGVGLRGYGFLADSGIEPSALRRGLAAAEDWGVTLPNALIALGAVTGTDYAEKVAAALDLPVLNWGFDVVRGPPLATYGDQAIRRIRRADGTIAIAIPATCGPLDGIIGTIRALAWTGLPVVIVSPRALADANERSGRRRALRRATFGLLGRQPSLSAALPLWRWQSNGLVALAGVFFGGWVVAPGATIAALLCLLTVPFVGVVVVRLIALHEILQIRPDATWVHSASDADLPTYSVLVPLFDEVAVLPDLIASLTKLDYPVAKLDLVLVLEETDLSTKAALLKLTLPPNMRAIVVPEFAPRTKPKALNYAMQFASGTFVVVFDAEDRPEPDQLRKATTAFRDGPVNLACVQARLNVYNATDSWFSRQFTVEYSALFDAILPALDRLGLPVPLGGTSNHFRRSLLDDLGGWDPHNVTEDADLGIRLARLGYVTRVLDSTTWEEAPTTWQQWKPQRTRWLKGWYQTYLVHTRSPSKLSRDLGPWRTLGFHLFLGGVILSTLVHPMFYLLVAWSWLAADAYAIPDIIGGSWLWLLAIGNLVLGYISAIAVGVIAVRQRGHGLVLSALQMPFCWLLVSVAAYRALWQLWRDPFLWEKTSHGAKEP